MFATDPGQPDQRGRAFLNAEDEVSDFLLGFAAMLLLIVAGEARNLPRSGEEAGVEIESGDAQFAVFNAAVG